MSHTYCNGLFHCVFSTSERRKTIPPEIRDDLWAYMGGVARQHAIKPVAIGGTTDHAHLLLALPASLSVAEAMRTIKGVFSQWLHEKQEMRMFAWQEGYGAFSIGASQIAATIRYILRQEEHHRRRDFQQEFLAILGKHGIEYDPLYVWG